MFPSIETALEDCEKHLDATGSRNSPIEVYLAGFLLIHIYANIDERVKALCHARCVACGDSPIGSLALSSLRPRRGEIKIGNLGDVLKKLDDNVGKQFSDNIAGQPCQSAWDNLLNNRHDFAHKSIYPQVTVADVRRFYTDALAVIQEFEAKMVQVHPTA